ncbi:MAG: acyl-CoA thioester hydrolase, partial [Solobacterium sp.]|nr:acyl-CoA thioester hydrolase [Solobacterium sp.]
QKAMIAMIGDSSTDLLATTAAKWLIQRGCHVLTMSADKKDYGHHNYPLERFEKAISVLHEKGTEKIGIIGASTTGMLALVASSYYPDITLTIALSPSDFVMEGFYQDGKDGMHERPGDNESSVSYQGKPLPYLPYAYRHPEYWQKIQEETKGSGNFISSINMFNESERLHPLQEEEKIKVERIKGKIIFVGAKDDVLWDTCKYIQRMEERLRTLPHECTWESLLYIHGTHFIFPESLLKMVLPFGEKTVLGMLFRDAKKHPNECMKTRIDIDRNLTRMIEEW